MITFSIKYARCLPGPIGISFLLLLLFATNPQALFARPPGVCTGCSISGAGSVAQGSSVTYTLSGCTSGTASTARWAVTCGTIVNCNDSSVTIKFNVSGCTSATISVLNGSGGVLAVKTVTVNAASAATGAIVRHLHSTTI